MGKSGRYRGWWVSPIDRSIDSFTGLVGKVDEMTAKERKWAEHNKERIGTSGKQRWRLNKGWKAFGHVSDRIGSSIVSPYQFLKNSSRK